MNVIGQIAVLFILAFFGAHFIEGVTWLAGKAGIGAYHVSIGFRTLGLACTYIVMRDVIRGMADRGWRSLTELLTIRY